MRIPDAQLELLAARLRGAGVERREFLRVAAGLALLGPAGFDARRAAAAPSLAPGERLAREQVFRYGGVGWWPSDPAGRYIYKELYPDGVAQILRRPYHIYADH